MTSVKSVVRGRTIELASDPSLAEGEEVVVTLRPAEASSEEPRLTRPLVNLFRRGLLTHAHLAHALGFDRFETDALLKRLWASEQSLTHEEVDADVESLRELLGRTGP